MSGRRTVHQLSGGLYVSGPPEQPKERPPKSVPRPVPYTGGDVRKSGELGKMFDIPAVADPASRPGSSSGSRPHSGPLPPPHSAPSSRSHSGPLSLIQPTGLITSGPIRRSGGQQDAPPSAAAVERSPAPPKKAGEGYGPAATVLSDEEAVYGFKIPKVLLWACLVVFGLGLAAGAFVLVVVHRAVILIAVASVILLVGAFALWNRVRGGIEVERFLRSYSDTAIDPGNLSIGKFVKITGVVTCGSVPLETSYRMIERCVYTSNELYEYRGWRGLPANPRHRRFTWGLRYSKRFVADFYISDQNSRTRFLVGAGNGNRVVSFVKSSKVIDMTNKNRDLSPAFQRWLSDNNISSDDRKMRLEEGLIQEGSTVSVMGILRKCENTLIIDPPTTAFSTSWQWSRCFFPMYVEGLILLGDPAPAEMVYHV